MEVAGAAGAATNNGEGIAGVGRDTTILPVRVLGKCGGMTRHHCRHALGRRVGGGWRFPANSATACPRAELSLGSRQVRVLRPTRKRWTRCARGVVVVASAGNSSRTVDTPGKLQWGHPAVGAAPFGTKSAFLPPARGWLTSVWGNCLMKLGWVVSIDFVGVQWWVQAPWADADNGSTYKAGLGTSFSAPMVGGTVVSDVGSST